MSLSAIRVIVSNTSRNTRLFIAVSFCRASVARTFGDAWIVSFQNANYAMLDQTARSCSITWKPMEAGIV